MDFIDTCYKVGNWPNDQNFTDDEYAIIRNRNKRLSKAVYKLEENIIMDTYRKWLS